MEKGSGRCEVCGCLYTDAEMIQRLRRRQLEQRRRELMEWPEHDASPDELLTHPPARVIAVHSTRRLLLMSLLFMTVIMLFLTQSIEQERSIVDLNPRELDVNLARLKRYALPTAHERESGMASSRAKASGVPQLDSPVQTQPMLLQPSATTGSNSGHAAAHSHEASPSPADVGLSGSAERAGSGSGGSGTASVKSASQEAAHAYGRYLTVLASGSEIALLATAARKGCSGDGEQASYLPPFDLACKRGELVVRFLRQRRALLRAQHAEEEAGEAMGRMARAFVMLCVLRICIAQQQHRRSGGLEVTRPLLPV